MFIVIESGRGISPAERSPLTAREALERIEEAEAHGGTVTCLDPNGDPVTKEELRRAAGSA